MTFWVGIMVPQCGTKMWNHYPYPESDTTLYSHSLRCSMTFWVGKTVPQCGTKLVPQFGAKLVPQYKAKVKYLSQTTHYFLCCCKQACLLAALIALTNAINVLL